jgi:predicted transcriptional regulator
MPDDAGSAPISIRVPADVLEKLDRIAAAIDRPRSWVCLRAIRRYLADEGAEILDVQQGIAELDRGEGMPFEDVVAELEDIIAQGEAKRGAV